MMSSVGLIARYTPWGQAVITYWSPPGARQVTIKPDGSRLEFELDTQGELTGMLLQYWPSGRLNMRTRFRNGVWDGLTEIFDEEGHLVCRKEQGWFGTQTIFYNADGSRKSQP
jgi:antitoxin component YwqK of YwqJK toxin-antitoxin module